MLANRRKVLARLGTYHRDVFAFSFTRAFWSGKKIFISHVHAETWNSLNDVYLFGLLCEQKNNEPMCRTIGTLLAAYCKYITLRKKEWYKNVYFV